MTLGLLALTASACSSLSRGNTTAGQRGIIKIGLGAPFSGYGGETAQQLSQGVRMAVQERNTAAGVSGYGVQLVSFDDEMNPDIAARRARELILDPQVIAALGHVASGTAAAARPWYEKGGLPFLSLAPGEPRQPAPRLFPVESELTAIAVDELSQVISGRRAVLVDINTLGDQQIADAFGARLRERGWSVVARQTVSDRVLRFASSVGSFASSQPDLVVFAGLPDQGTALAEELARQLPDVWFIGVTTADAPQWNRVAGARLLTLRLDWRKDTAESGEFAARFRAATGQSASGYAELAYDTAGLLLDVASASPSREGVAAALAKRADSDGRIPLGSAWSPRLIKVAPVH